VPFCAYNNLHRARRGAKYQIPNINFQTSAKYQIKNTQFI